MFRILTVLIGVFTLSLPAWFAYLDRKAFPRLRWVEEGEGPPLWGKLVVVVGVGLVILIAYVAPWADFESLH